jgi:hypothetical protein
MPPGRYSGDLEENHSLTASWQRKGETLDATVGGLAGLDADQLHLQWRNHLGGTLAANFRFQSCCLRRSARVRAQEEDRMRMLVKRSRHGQIQFV